MKKILIVQPIHEKGMELLKSNSDYSYEVVEDLSVENVKQKIVDADAVSLRTVSYTHLTLPTIYSV